MRSCDTRDDDRCISETELPTTTDSCDEAKPTKPKRRKSLRAFEFSEIIVKKELKTRTDVLAFAHTQKNEGKTDIGEFIINRGQRLSMTSHSTITVILIQNG